MTSLLEIKEPEALLGAPQVMIWLSNEEHRCVYCNQALINFSGGKELSGDSWQDLVHPDDLKKVRENQQSLLSEPKFGFFRQEYRSLRPQGNYSWMLDISFPRFEPSGRFLGYIGSVVDITEQKSQEENLRQHQSRLEKQILEVSDRERFRLSKGLQEDLCQTLNGLALKATLLERKLHEPKTEPAAKVASQIASELQQLAFRTKEISQSLFPALIIDESFQLVIQDLAERVEERFGVNISCRFGTPETAANSEKNLHIYRIIEEAIHNAIRHGRARHIRIDLDTDSEKKNRVTISDDGSGISSSQPISYGLGLRVMEYRAKLIGGDLQIEPRPKGGTLVRCLY